MTHKPDADINLVCVLRTDDPGLLLAAKALLASAGVDHVVHGEESLRLTEWHEGFQDSDAAQIIVREDDAPAARALMNSLGEDGPPES